MGIFSRRLPARSEIVLVFGVAVFAIHSWSVREFLYKAPAFLLYYSVWEIFSVFSYMMAFALLESALLTLLLVVPAVVLPSRLLRDGFGYKGFLAILVASVLSIWFQGALSNQYPPRSLLLTGGGVALGAFLLLVLLFHFIPFLQKAALAIADRLGIMAYLYVPLGLIGFLVVILRNLFSILQVAR